jgi:hypothetical protein
MAVLALALLLIIAPIHPDGLLLALLVGSTAVMIRDGLAALVRSPVTARGRGRAGLCLTRATSIGASQGAPFSPGSLPVSSR